MHYRIIIIILGIGNILFYCYAYRKDENFNKLSVCYLIS